MVGTRNSAMGFCRGSCGGDIEQEGIDVHLEREESAGKEDSS